MQLAWGGRRAHSSGAAGVAQLSRGGEGEDGAELFELLHLFVPLGQLTVDVIILGLLSKSFSLFLRRFLSSPSGVPGAGQLQEAHPSLYQYLSSGGCCLLFQHVSPLSHQQGLNKERTYSTALSIAVVQTG